MTWGPLDRWLAACWRQPIRLLCWLTGLSSLGLASWCVMGTLVTGLPAAVLDMVEHRNVWLFCTHLFVVAMATFNLASAVADLAGNRGGVVDGVAFGTLVILRLWYCWMLVVLVASTLGGGVEWVWLPGCSCVTIGSYAATEDLGGGSSLFARARDRLFTMSLRSLRSLQGA